MVVLKRQNPRQNAWNTLCFHEFVKPNHTCPNGVSSCGAIEGSSGKDSVKDDLIIALDQTVRDEYFFCKEVLTYLVENIKSKNPKIESTKKIDVIFTRREKEILNLLTNGLSSKEIGEKLFISPRTVDAHKYNVMQKLKVNSSSELVYFALKNQLI